MLEQPTHDPVLNVERESSFMTTAEVPSFRVWRSTGFCRPGQVSGPRTDEVNLSLAVRRARRPGTRRGPAAVALSIHDLGNVNYSIYLPGDSIPGFEHRKSLWLLSFPVTELLDSFGIDWSWEPPNNVYVRGAKISGSAQARSKGRLLHHGTLLVNTNLDRMHELLKPGGRSCVSPVVNLNQILSGVTPENVVLMLTDILRGRGPAIKGSLDDSDHVLVEEGSRK